MFGLHALRLSKRQRAESELSRRDLTFDTSGGVGGGGGGNRTFGPSGDGNRSWESEASSGSLRGSDVGEEHLGGGRFPMWNKFLSLPSTNKFAIAPMYVAR